jgi:hypothetical protein
MNASLIKAMIYAYIRARTDFKIRGSSFFWCSHDVVSILFPSSNGGKKDTDKNASKVKN